MEALQEVLIQLLVVVIGLVTAFVGQRTTAMLNKKGILAQLENKKAYVDIVVNAVQQTLKEADAKTKLNTAKKDLVKIFNDNGVKFTESELDSLIESAVIGMKKGIAEGK